MFVDVYSVCVNIKRNQSQSEQSRNHGNSFITAHIVARLTGRQTKPHSGNEVSGGRARYLNPYNPRLALLIQTPVNIKMSLNGVSSF